MIASRRLNERVAENLSALERYISLLHYIKAQVDCFVLPISDILKRADGEMLFGCGWRGDVPPSSLEELISRASLDDSAAQSILLEFCSDFGKSYLDDQLRRCDHYISLLEDRREILGRELPSKKKLNSTLCISAALAIVILLI